ncbi:hypothetical protein [uncultured Desulfobacter sp.]|uniref:hypothetical protein n=1 Tax=uncultured Desulfobacter sp. TaxID=240139 RepID=UPI002AAC3D07|nr:hypothetical protein [uncultured Desulfobacter sp.]
MGKFKIFLVAVCALVMLVAVPHLNAEEVSGEATDTPWSGWWWPSYRGGLVTGVGYRGSPAPLEKYDLITSNVKRGPASNYYLTYNYDPDAETWVGLCDAWSAAAIMEPIDFVPSTVNNLLFRIGDKKGLLTLAYELSYQSDEYETVDSPLVLHNWLLNYIGEKSLAFYAEIDPSDEAWNYPVYKYLMDIDDFGDEEYVTCTIWYADDQVAPDYSGTKEVQKTYYYTLVKSGSEYVSSSWDSQNSYDHPTYVLRPESYNIKNPYLDYDTIKEMAVSSDDLAESDLPVSLNPGFYNMILLNEDIYLLGEKEGELITINLERIDDTDETIQYSITDSDGTLLSQGDLDTDVSLTVNSGVPPYELVFSKDSYDLPGIYTLTYDIKKGFEFVRAKAQKGYGWGGYALVNASDEEVSNIMISGYASDGSPVDTYLGPFTLGPGKKYVILSDDFPFRNQMEKDDFYGIKIHAPEAISIVNLSGEYEEQMASFQGDVFDTQLVVPESPCTSDYSVIKSWGVYNPQGSDITAQFQLFSDSGEAVEDVSIALNSKEIDHFTRSSSPFDDNTASGWILINASAAVSVYEGWVSRSSDANEMIPGLIPGTEFYLPNPASDSIWSTQLTLINIEDETVVVSVQLLSSSYDPVTEVIELDSHAKIETDLAALFPGVTGGKLCAGFIKIEATGAIAGYYTYETTIAQDMIKLPLNAASDVTTALCLPHVASDSIWWTGMVLCNTGDAVSSVRFTPFDAQGNSLTDGVVKNLEINGKSSYMIRDMFNVAIIPDIAHIRIKVEQGSPVLGTYGYGSADMQMLTGAILE